MKYRRSNKIGIILLLSTTIFAIRAISNNMGEPVKPLKVIDSHLHVWASSTESVKFPYSEGQQPPEMLREQASYSSLLDQMQIANVDGALIVQPINHKYDHSYVADAIKKYPTKFKGMLLHDPSLSATEAVTSLEDLTLQGFCGVRFNPYLWSEGDKMSEIGGSGLAVYKRCGELKQPVGVMCFKGLDLHYDDILKLIDSSPDTTLVVDHFGFTDIYSEKGDENFKRLLSLANYNDNVVVKISALFRVAGDDTYPYNDLKKKRFLPLLENFGADRLMFGTDFPFVLEEDGYQKTVDLVKKWCASTNNANDATMIMSGTAERIFGFWG